MSVRELSLKLCRFADKKPEHGQEIFLFKYDSYYRAIAPKFAEVEYDWVEYDEKGDPTGVRICYDPADPEPPEGCRVEILLLHNVNYTEEDLWCPATDIDDLFSPEGGKVNSPFEFRPPAWANTKPPTSPTEALGRALDLAKSYYALGTQTGVHAMIEWCGVMSEHANMLEEAYNIHGIEPDQVDQHSDTCVPVPKHRVEYLCEKLGCQLKPFIRANPDLWRRVIDLWFEGSEIKKRKK